MAHRLRTALFAALSIVVSGPACVAGELHPLRDGVEDAVAMFAAPASWEASDWAVVGGGVAAVLAAGAWDRPMHGQWSGGHDGLANFGNAYAYAAPATLVLLYGGTGLATRDAEAWRTAWEVGEAAALSVLLTGALKVGIGRERPDATGRNRARFHPFSFADRRMSLPSGHTALAFSTAAVLQEKDWPLAVRAVPFALAGVTAWSRVHDNRHWLSDVVAGALVGYGVGRFVVHRNGKRAEDAGYFVPRFDDKGWGIVWHKRF